MDFTICTKTSDKKRLLKFRKDLYRDDINFKNNDEVLINQMLYASTEFARNNDISGLLIEDGIEIVACCLLIHAKEYKDYLQIAFFESSINEDKIVNELISYAKRICLKNSISTILVGMNGHVNYGLGIMDNNFDKPQSFGGSFNKPYYSEMWERVCTRNTKLVSFYKDMSELKFEKYRRILDKIGIRFNYRYINKRDLKSEMQIYTELNNKAFAEHDFYFERESILDYELFKDLFYLIDEENLIFAYEGNKPVGFMLWYPDFNKLIPPGKHFGIKTVIKSKFFSQKIDGFKLMEMGVLPEYRDTGVVLGLFNECYNRTKERFRFCETSWIMEKNFKSRNFGVKFDAQPYKQFSVFEIDVGG